MDKLQNWSMYFILCLSLVRNISIVSIWSITFLILYQFSLYYYYWMKKNQCVKWNNKKNTIYHDTSTANCITIHHIKLLKIKPKLKFKQLKSILSH